MFPPLISLMLSFLSPANLEPSVVGGAWSMKKHFQPQLSIIGCKSMLNKISIMAEYLKIMSEDEL